MENTTTTTKMDVTHFHIVFGLSLSNMFEYQVYQKLILISL